MKFHNRLFAGLLALACACFSGVVHADTLADTLADIMKAGVL